MLSAKKVFKEKKSIKTELELALLNKTPISYSILAKNVGISIYRVRKYCKTRHIDLNNYNSDILKQPIKKLLNNNNENNNASSNNQSKKRKVKKIDLGSSSHTKINLGSPNNIKIKLEED